jgi:hypothetical protein
MNSTKPITAVAVLNITPGSVAGRITVEGLETRAFRSELELFAALEALRDVALEDARVAA